MIIIIAVKIFIATKCLNKIKNASIIADANNGLVIELADALRLKFFLEETPSKIRLVYRDIKVAAAAPTRAYCGAIEIPIFIKK